MKYLTAIVMAYLMIPMVTDGQRFDLGVGQWQDHTATTFGRHVTQNEEKVFFASNVYVTVFDKTEQSVEKWDKTNFLRSSGVRLVKWIPWEKALLVLYQDMTIDMVYENLTRSFTNLGKDGNFSDRTVLSIDLDIERKKVYFGTVYGVVQFSPSENKFGFTFNYGKAVNQIVVYQDSIYLATNEGVLVTSLDERVNKQDVGSWKKWNTPLLGQNFSCQALTRFSNQWVIGGLHEVYRLDNNQLIELFSDADDEVRYLTSEGPDLLVGIFCYNGSSDCTGQTRVYDTNWNLKVAGFACVDRPNYAIQDNLRRYYFADGYDGFRTTSDNITDGCRVLKINTQQSERSEQIAVSGPDRVLVMTHNGSASEFGFRGYYEYYNKNWINYTGFSDPFQFQNNIQSFYTVLPDLKDTSIVYFGSFFSGLLERKSGVMTLYNAAKGNAPIQPAIGDPGTTRVAGLAYGADGTLWLTNHLSPTPLIARRKDGTWLNGFLTNSQPNKGFRHLLVDSKGYKWMTVDNAGVVVYNDNKTLEDVSDDQVFNITTSNTDLPNLNVNCLAEDKDGAVWLGTAEGPISFGCDVFSGSSCRGSRGRVNADGTDEYLLKETRITSIAIDGANRQWFGTESGIFVFKQNGQRSDLELFFNTENSPLPDNLINDIAIDPESGKVFIATGKGVMAYGGQATETNGNSGIGTVYAFPNPVRPEYKGPITIRGLAFDSDFKITDVRGQIIFQGRSTGGQAIWNGTDLDGKRASTGVYLIWSTNKNTERPEAVVTKVLFVEN